jgi:uncharacterized protein (DUF983 family)
MSVFSKGSKIYSISKFRCPRCHEGDVFVEANPYKMGSLFTMHENCPHCEFRYVMEPSFFFGAMYVSYGYSVALFVATYVIMNLIYEPSLLQVIIALAAVVLVLSPLVLRLSRLTWLNLFVKYDPKKRGPSLK